VTECIEEGILSDFLRSQRAEVIAVSIFEYNEEEELKKLRQAEFRSGQEEGITKGIAKSVLLLLEMKGSVPEHLREQIIAETNAALLENWLQAAAKACTVEAFMEETGLKGK
jgi:hypothetical protein